MVRENGRFVGVLKKKGLEERGVVVVVVAARGFAGVKLKTLMGFANFEGVGVTVSAIVRRDRNGHRVGVFLEMFGMTGHTPHRVDVLEKNGILRVSKLRDGMRIIGQFEIICMARVACFIADS